VIGSGLLAPEVAATLTHLGLCVDLVVGGPHPWKKYAGEATGRFLTRYLEKNGVRVHLNADPTRLEGDGRVQRVVLSNGPTLPCDFVVPAIGVAANKELLRGTAIAAEKAILVDDHCRTSLPDIYAAGDVAAVFDPLFGKHRQIDHWDNAIASGTVAGRNMAGQDVRYDAVSTFNSEIFGLRIEVWGAAKMVDRRILRGAPADNGNFVEIGVAADGRVAQVLAVNHSADAETLRELVRRRLNVSGKEEQLKDPTASLADVLA
jgi:NADPH-dependent 2,4-dienoyl-CoA reductase/sulfur reductase-like enzyme